MRQIVLIAHNLRSAHNVGSLLRTADGIGVGKIYLTGYTPYPLRETDDRLPHLAKKLDSQIHKTALGAEKSENWKHSSDIRKLITQLKNDGYEVAGLEQTPSALHLPEFVAPPKVAIIVGREVEGLEPEVLALCDITVQIPMLGTKESFNVVQAAAMALYHARWVDKT